MPLVPTASTHTARPHDLYGTDHHDQPHSNRPGYLGALPTELKLAVIDADPDAALALMDTTHEFEMLVCGGPLRPLFQYFERSPGRLRSFLQAGIRSGKTANQFVRLAKVFDEVTSAPPECVRYAARYLVELGMLTPRIYNAMCPEFVHLLCDKDTLTFSFSRRFPLLSEGELAEHQNMLQPYADEHAVNHVSELDIVLLRIAPALGERGLLGLAFEQLFDRDRFGRFLVPNGFADREEAYTYSRIDSAALAQMLKRFYCAMDLRVINFDRSARDGALYRTAFGSAGSSSAGCQSTASQSSPRVRILPGAGRRHTRDDQRIWLFQLFRQL